MRSSVAAAAGNVPSEVLDTVVVGAGISGLVTAQALQTKHGDKVQSFLVTEGRERVGGNITSLQGDGYIWEEGPNSFQPNDAMLQAAVSAWVPATEAVHKQLLKKRNLTCYLHLSRCTPKLASAMRCHEPVEPDACKPKQHV
jgi:monoamine oxidase